MSASGRAVELLLPGRGLNGWSEDIQTVREAQPEEVGPRERIALHYRPARLVRLQRSRRAQTRSPTGDTRHAGNPSDGAIARQQIAQVLVTSLTSEAVLRKTFELVATKGSAKSDIEPLFTALEPDPEGALGGIWSENSELVGDLMPQAIAR
jgi:hypothetical protein